MGRGKEERASVYREFAARAASAAAKAGAPGATAHDVEMAKRAAADLRGMASQFEYLGEAVPTSDVIAAPAASAGPLLRPAPKPKTETRTREEQIRTIAAGSPFPLSAEAVSAAVASGQTVESFALAVADHCETERVVTRIVGDSAAPATSLPRPTVNADQGDAEAIARRIIAA